jgi:hypothetical protein
MNGDGKGEYETEYPECFSQDSFNTFSYVKCPSGTVVSSAEGIPLADLNQTQAISLCEGIGGHLISNDEWMTIARNIELVPENWSGGIVGSGYLFKGNHLFDDIHLGLKDGFTDMTGVSKRTFTLSNGEVVWDLSGNATEILSDTILQKDQPEVWNTYDGTLLSASFWNGSVGYSDNFYLNSSNLGNTTLEVKDLFLSNLDYNQSHGLGSVFTLTDINSTSDLNHIFLRSYGGSITGGLLSLRLQLLPYSHFSSTGFRCVIVP